MQVFVCVFCVCVRELYLWARAHHSAFKQVKQNMKKILIKALSKPGAIVEVGVFMCLEVHGAACGCRLLEIVSGVL